MDNQNREDLTELFKELFDAERAKECIEDIQKAEQILLEHPAPEPDDMLIANIKAEIAMRLPADRGHLVRGILYRAAAVAAAVIVLATVSVQFLKNGGQPAAPGTLAQASLIPTAIWESDDIATDDANLAVFTAEIEQIEDEVMTLQAGEDSSNGDSRIVELEIELIEISSDFWKG
jgi:hypothetical protein